MEAYYFRRPTAAELEGTGFLPEHYEEPEVDVWPENWEAWSTFTLLQAQWRCGPAGPLGLDYAVVFQYLEHRGVTGEDRDDVLDCLQVIEVEAMAKITRS